MSWLELALSRPSEPLDSSERLRSMPSPVDAMRLSPTSHPCGDKPSTRW